MSRTMRMWAGLALGAALCGCQQTTVIRSDPPGAEIWVNLVRLGEAPASFETRAGLPDTARIKADLEGYVPVRDLPMEKRYRADLSLLWLIPGLIPYVFTARFDDEVVVKLEPKAGGQAEPR